MGEMIYRAVDLSSGVVLNDLPLDIAELPRLVSSDADQQATIPLYDVDVRELKPREVTTPGRTGIFALRDGQPVWAGIIWARSYKRSTRQLTLTLSTMESYYRHRVFNQRLIVTQRDQTETAIWLMTGIWPTGGYTNVKERQLSWTQGPDYDPTQYTLKDVLWGMYISDYDGNSIRVSDNLAVVTYPYEWNPSEQAWDTTAPDSGVLRDRSYDAGKNVYDAISEMASLERGFEWTLEPGFNPDGSLTCFPRFGYPRLGRTVDKTVFTWTSSQPKESDEESDTTTPGDNVEDYDYTEDTRNSANHLVSTGAEVNGIVLVSDRGDLQKIRNGYPTLQATTSYSDVVFQPTLDSHALGDLNSKPLPAKTTVWEVSSTLEPEFGTYSLGDEGYFQASDDMDPVQDSGLPGRNSVERIVGWSLVPQSDTQREIVKLVTNPTTQPGVTLPPKLLRRFDNLQRQIKGLAVVGRQQQQKVAVSSTNTQNVVLPNSGTAFTDGPVQVVTSYYFLKQADYLHGMFVVAAGLAGASWAPFDSRDGSQMAWTGTVAKMPGGGLPEGYPGTVYDLKISLAGWDFGDLVEIEFRAWISGSGSTTATRTVRSWAAYQGPN